MTILLELLDETQIPYVAPLTTELIDSQWHVLSDGLFVCAESNEDLANLKIVAIEDAVAEAIAHQPGPVIVIVIDDL